MISRLACPSTLLLLAVALIAVSRVREASAAWPAQASVGGVVVCDTTGDQEEFRILSDGVGGVYCLWADVRTGFGEVRLKRFNASGLAAGWPEQGLRIADRTIGASVLTLAPNGAGMIVATWWSSPDSKVKSQCFDSTGAAFWTPGGAILANHFIDLYNGVAVSPDGSRVYAGVTGTANGPTIAAIRQRPDGSLAWPAPIGLRESFQPVYEPVICAITDSTVAITWRDDRTGAPGIYGQSLDRNGNILWGDGGKRLMPTPATEGRLSPNGLGGLSGCYLSLVDDPTFGDFRLFNVDANGDTLRHWPSGGLPYITEPNQNPGGLPAVTFTDIPGEVLLGWRDTYDTPNGIFRVQRFDTTATPLWPGRGRIAYQATSPTGDTHGWPDGKGGFCVSVLGKSPGYDVFGQYVRPDGSAKWLTPFVPVCTAAGVQDRGTYTAQLVTPDSSGGAFYCWVDYRNASTASDLYIQHVNADGTLGGVVTATEASAVSATFLEGCAEVRWHASVDPGVSFTLQRQPEDGEWVAIGVPADEGEDLWAARDCAVERGARYAYRLEWSQDGELRHSAAISLAIPLQPQFAFSSPWPNPVRDRMSFDYSLSRSGAVRVSLLDLSGREVSLIESGVRDAGEHRVTWRAGGRGGGVLRPGCYWVQLEAEGQKRSRQIVVVK
ncbi:MAG: hypothetical protein IT348_12615 [Candidatus Eisenbacteria bacterium]|nr:hypothetical protein [Candidatus Eisenbacteria bacterium]